MASATGHRIGDLLLSQMRGRWDGRVCVEYLRRFDYQWRQMEWIGWYFEQRARSVLVEALGGGPGPCYGNVEFDYACDGVWDFKAHPTNQAAGWAYLNDVEAVRTCVHEHRHLGWVIAHGTADYDATGTFKAWHDALKGKTSAYEVERIRRGAKSRRRKVAFSLEGVAVVEFHGRDDLDAAVRAGWLREDMQERQRNADGSPRAAKYGINLSLWRQAARGP